MRVELDVIAGPAEGQHFTFDKEDCFLFGRSTDAHISVPNDRYVSRQHFLLEISPPECKLIDLNSKNGVFVNRIRYGGQKPPKPGFKLAPDGAKEVYLKDGDEITVGDSRIKISIHSDRFAPERVLGERGSNKNIPSVGESSAKLPDIRGYHIEQEIGRGFLGVVYKAIETATGSPVAIKIVSPEVTVDPCQVKLFQRELDILCKLEHKNIVRFFKHGITDGVFYFIFEFVDGLDLVQFLQAQGGMTSIDEAIPIFMGILDGLAYAHHARITLRTPDGQRKTFKGIVHRDLKPQNILLARQEHVWISKITDFGLAKGFESLGVTNLTTLEGILSAPIYWPREQITHHTYPGLTTDVFSIAAVFYEMLTGTWVREGFQELFDNCRQSGHLPAISEYLKVIAANPPIPIGQRNRNIPEPLAEVIDKALRETELPRTRAEMRKVLKALRYPDAGAFQSALAKVFKEIEISEPLKSSRQKSHTIPWEPISGEGLDIEQTGAGTVIYSTITPTARRKEALLLIDLAQSTQFVLDMGDTSFSGLIGSIYKKIKAHSLTSELIFLKCTGDGFLTVFHTIHAAFSLALTFLETGVHPDVHIRMALHWGSVTTGPNEEILGTEVNRVSQIEGVTIREQIEPPESGDIFPIHDRILVTKEGLEQLNAQDKAKFKPAGKFRLKGFGKPCELWICA